MTTKKDKATKTSKERFAERMTGEVDDYRPTEKKDENLDNPPSKL